MDQGGTLQKNIHCFQVPLWTDDMPGSNSHKIGYMRTGNNNTNDINIATIIAHTVSVTALKKHIQM